MHVAGHAGLGTTTAQPRPLRAPRRAARSNGVVSSPMKPHGSAASVDGSSANHRSRSAQTTPGMAEALDRWSFAIACVDAVEVALREQKGSRSKKRTVVYYVIRIQYRGDDDQVDTRR